jgi:hypothetical protein
VLTKETGWEGVLARALEWLDQRVAPARAAAGDGGGSEQKRDAAAEAEAEAA